MVIPLCVEYLALAHCSLQEPFCQPDMLQQESLIPFIISPLKKKKADELTERQHHLIPMKKGLCGLQKLILLRHHPSDLSLQVVRVGRTGIFGEVFADYVCVSEERKRTTAGVCV